MRVREFGIGHRDLAHQTPQGQPFAGPLHLLQTGLDPLVDQGVDAADEETGDTGHPGDLAASGGQFFQAGHVRVGYLFVVLLREEQGDVDVHAFADQVFDRGNAGRGSRHFDHQIPAADRAGQAPGLLDGAGRVVGQMGRDLQGDKAVPALAFLVDRQQQIRGPLDVLDGDLLEDFPRALARAGKGLERAGVVGRARNGLLENGRIGGQAANPVVLDQALQAPGHDQTALDIVVPHALALRPQVQEGIGHGLTPCGKQKKSSKPVCA